MRVYMMILLVTWSTGEQGTFEYLARGDKELARYKSEYGSRLVSVRELNCDESYSCDTCQDLVTYPHKCEFPCW